MVYRIYVEKKPGFDGEAQGLKHELVELVGIKGLKALRLLNRYDVEGIDRDLFEKAIPTVFSEPPVDVTYTELPTAKTVFAVEYLPGQFDQRADSASECIQLLSQGERPSVRSARIYLLDGELSAEDLEAIKKYVINPVEAREASLDTRDTLKMEFAVPTAVETLNGFCALDDAALENFRNEKGLAMDHADIVFCQNYFKSEQRDPTITEIRLIDTYWSDHCRHTTFGTILNDVKIDDEVVQAAFDRYMALRAETGRDKKNRTLMDLATIGAKARASAMALLRHKHTMPLPSRIICAITPTPMVSAAMTKSASFSRSWSSSKITGMPACIAAMARARAGGKWFAGVGVAALWAA